ncbi:inorganic polyphosphate/ATP-NAD kinase [Gracilibacillus halophilus YIM-C55.5]|uniref:NAD kinase n=1 Tax=Gracilibacillus halophilus YIM-C55.5 TaxID=1308866 RepID=N4W9H7_9BACI|nr:NAD kinase [Gracilibacillus halophilus]ENH96933.1 inorganic polyphosphate/ATP-NAD kinase [Gracilibacillus halophilus YIM-C55.5]
MEQRTNIYFYYKGNDKIEKQLEPLVQRLEENLFEMVEDPDDANIVVSIGGDGEFLQAVRHTGFRQDCLYVGIARANESALYCDFHLDNYEQVVAAMNGEALEVRRFPVIDVTINGEATFQCLNEAAIRSAVIKTIVMDVHIDGKQFERFRGDGLIVSTPTGSTGYNKSTLGAVVDPKLPCFQVSELASLNNNQYRTLGSSFILDQERTLELEVIQDGNDYPIIGLDNEAYSIRNIQNVNIQLSEKRIKTVKLKDNTFWDRVQRTFL